MINLIRKIARSKENSLKNEKLIEKLKKDHYILLKTFEEMEEALKVVRRGKKGSSHFFRKFDKFLKELSLHLTLENSQLYTHIETKYRLCELKKIEQIKNEIINHSHLFENVKRYVKEKRFQEAEETLLTIKIFLASRIKFEEEKLYDIYNKPYRCDEVIRKLN